MKRSAAFALFALAALGSAPRVWAARASVSYSTWILSRVERTVTLRYSLPKPAAQQLSGTRTAVLTVSKVGQYVLAHTSVHNDGRDCPAIDQGYDIGRVDPLDLGPRLYGFELVFRCTEPLGTLSLGNSALFARDRTHVDFARIELGRHFARQLFTAGHQKLRVEARWPIASAPIQGYIRLGWLHLLSSPLRVAFLIVVLLLVRRFLDLGELLGGLTAGYALSFLAQASGVFVPRIPLIDGFIGALVALVAIRIAMLNLDRPRILQFGWPALLMLLALVAVILRTPQAALLLVGFALYSAGFLRLQRENRPFGLLILSGLFAFLDGWVLPALLAPVHLMAATRAPMVIGYDAGALFADATLGVFVAALALALSKVGYLEVMRRVAHEAAAACLAGLGTFWLLANAARTVPVHSVHSAKPSIIETLSHVDQTTANPDSLLMRDYFLMGNTLVPIAEKPKDCGKHC